ncbi:MAG: hypothetical protein GVY36_02820 [Verrucomicrobia bacterium]|nr:hypothetical protein [Verrucomicrobiota bacterium]
MQKEISNHRVRFSKWTCHFSKHRHFFVSYPKSGRTWVRFLVNAYKAKLFKIDVANVFKVERKLRLKHHVEWTHLSGHQKNAYYAMRPNNISILTKTPCVFMLRNFHATLASAWFQVTQRLGVSLDSKNSFLFGTEYGIMHIISFYNSWIEIQNDLTNVTYISYKRLKSDTRNEFVKILEALGLPLDETLINETLEMGSFENMKRLGASEDYAKTVLAPTDRTNPNSAKVRSGSAESFREVFTDEQINYINKSIERYFLGYSNPKFAECIEINV